MTGLEKMVNQILEEARTSAAQKKAEAQAQADEILAQARAEAETQAQEMEKQAGSAAAARRERAKSSADLKRKTEILAAKQDLIADTLGKAYETLCRKDDAEYFGILKKLAGQYAHGQKGEISLCAEDLQRLPEGFAQEIADAAKEKGGELTLSATPAQIERGFILSYGGVEENCSFRSLFDARKDDLQDLVQKMLFL